MNQKPCRKQSVPKPGNVILTLLHQFNMWTVTEEDTAPTGEVSPALRDQLRMHDLVELTVILISLGMRTKRALQNLSTTSRHVLLEKGKKLWQLLDNHSSIEKALEAMLLANGVPVGGRSLVAGPGQTPLEPGFVVVGQATGACGIEICCFPPCVQEATAATDPHVHAPAALEVTSLTRALPRALDNVSRVLSRETLKDVIESLEESAKLADQSAWHAGKAFGLLYLDKPVVNSLSRENKDFWKKARKEIRDLVVWRCWSVCLGWDSRAAMVKACSDAVASTCCDVNALSQLENGCKRVKNDIVDAYGLTPMMTRAALAAANLAKQKAKEAAKKAQGQVPDGAETAIQPDAAVDMAAAVGSQQEQELGSEEEEEQENEPADATQTVSFSPVVGSVSPNPPRKQSNRGIGMPMSSIAEEPTIEIPTGSNETPRWSKGQPSGVEGQAGNCTGRELHRQGTAQAGDCTDNTSTVKNESSNKICRVITQFIAVSLCSLEAADTDQSGITAAARCLSMALDYRTLVPVQYESLVERGLVALAIAARRDEQFSKQALMFMAKIAGPRFPSIPFSLLTAEPEATMSADIMSDPLMPAVAEVWAGLLTGNGTFVLKYLDMEVSETGTRGGEHRLKMLVDFTIDVFNRCSSSAKETAARHSCASMGALTLIVKDEPALVETISKWLLETIEKMRGYPNVVDECLDVLKGLCKVCKEIFGISCRQMQDGQQERITSQLQNQVMEAAVNCIDGQDFRNDRMCNVVKLLVHTHKLQEVLRVIILQCTRVNRCWEEMMKSMLDEIEESLSSNLESWTKAGESQTPAHEAHDSQHAQADNIFSKVHLHGVISEMFMEQLESAIQRNSRLWTSPDGHSVRVEVLRMLVGWAKSTSEQQQQKRLLLVGMLFGPWTLLPSLLFLPGTSSLLYGRCIDAEPQVDQELVAACCKSLVALNCLMQFKKSLKEQVLKSLLCMEAPQTAESCSAWVGAIGKVLPVQGELVVQACKKIMHVTDSKVCCEGWAAFTHEAMCVLSGLNEAFVSNKKELSFLAAKVKAAMTSQVRATRQAEWLIDKLNTQ